jgi:hypothetical protein
MMAIKVKKKLRVVRRMTLVNEQGASEGAAARG